MLKSIIKLGFAGLLLLFAVACKKQIDTPADNQDALTPYTLQIPSGFPAMLIPSDNPMTVEGVALGKQLFFDPILSGNNTMSCATCHMQKFGFSDSANQFSTGIDGLKGPRNAMPLINLGWASNFFWDGGAANLESQVVGPIQNPLEMHQDLAAAIAELNAHPSYPTLFKKVYGGSVITTSMLMRAIAQFERTLISGNSKYDQYVKGTATLTPQEMRGLNLFSDPKKGDCNHCHVLGGTFTDFEYRNTGLDSIAIDKGRELITLKVPDRGRFKTPTLRNIAITGPYMHDGRFKTLEACIQHYNIGFKYAMNLDPNLENSVKGRLNTNEISDIVAFLNTLTDTEFLSNPAFKP